MRRARKSVFGRERRRGNDRKLKVRVRKVYGRKGGRRGKVVFNQRSAKQVDDNVLFLAKLRGYGKPVGEHVTIDIRHFFGKVQSRRARVDKNGCADVDKPRRFLCDFNFFVRVDRRFLHVRLARRFLDVFYGHSAAANADNASFFFQQKQIATKCHQRNFGEIFAQLFQSKLSALVEQFGNFRNSFSFHSGYFSFLDYPYKMYHKFSKNASK